MKTFIRIAVGVAALACAVAVFHPNGRWRTRVIFQKLSGDFPGLSWSETLGALGSEKWGVGDPELVGLFSGLVQAVRIEDGGPCPVEWSTPFGAIWAGRGDDDLLENTVFGRSRLTEPPNGAVLDIGAGDGLFAKYALESGAEIVVVYDESAALVECLKRTLENEIALERATVVHMNVPDREATGRFELVSGDAQSGPEYGAILETLQALGRNAGLIRVSAQWAGRHGLATIAPVLEQQAVPVLITDDLVSGSVTALGVDAGSPCPVLWQTSLGALWGRYIESSLLEWLELELNEYQVYEHDAVHVTAGDVVIDVGGHLGMFTLEALAKGAGEVVVFEPEPTNVDCLKKTFQTQIEEGRVVLVDAAAWEEQGTLKFSTGSEDAGSGSARGQVSDSGEIVVRADTIDAVVERLGLSRVDFIKMDIEGAERHALAGARRTIEKFGPKMALCVYHREDDPEVLPAVVTSERADYTIEAGEGVRSGQIYCWRRGAKANPGL